MKKRIIITLFAIISIAQSYTQAQTMHIVLQKQDQPYYSSSYFLEKKDISQFEIPVILHARQH